MPYDMNYQRVLLHNRRSVRSGLFGKSYPNPYFISCGNRQPTSQNVGAFIG